MDIEKQTSWGVLVALDMFLGGMGTGAFIMGFILYQLGIMKSLAITGMLLGPVFVILGLICLLLELGSPLKSYRLFMGLSTSWMSRGGLIQILHIISALAYVLPSFWIPEWLDSGVGMALVIIALILALAIGAYHGMILNEARAIPLWSSSIMPLLTFLTALCSGLGLLLSISPAYVGLYGSAEVVSSMSILGIAGITLIIGKLITIWSLINSRPSATYVASIRRIWAPIIVDVVCLILALFLLSLGLVIGEETHFMWISLISGVLLLAGGFIIRYSILRAGYYAPLQILI
jgi:formate-dependent nitrite reductase membrane component NrfD